MSTSAELQLSVPTELESPRAKLVYLSLSTAGDATVTELQRRLGLSKLTLFSVLDALAAEDLVRETDSGYTCLSRPPAPSG